MSGTEDIKFDTMSKYDKPQAPVGCTVQPMQTAFPIQSPEKQSSEADSAQTMKTAFDFFTSVFGPQWAEKTSSYFMQIQSEICMLSQRVEDANEQIIRRADEINRIRGELAGKEAQVRQLALEKENVVKAANQKIGLVKAENEKQLAEARNEMNARLYAFEQEKTDRATESEHFKREVDSLQQTVTQLNEQLRGKDDNLRNTVLFAISGVFGSDSDVYRYVYNIDQDRIAPIGYLCLYSFPSPNARVQDGAAMQAFHALNALGNRFIENIKDLEGNDRSRLLNLMADQLSKVSGQFSFSNEEGQTFHPDRHSVKSGSAAPGGRIIRIQSFLVKNNRTNAVQQRAEVVL